MKNSPDIPKPKDRDEMRAAMEAHQRRKLKARSDEERGIWFGHGMFGLVGWSVAVPIVVFTVVGVWLDRDYPARFSWTLSLLFLGVVLGCLNAWFWVKREGGDD
jgi:ATP synthase protein I